MIVNISDYKLLLDLAVSKADKGYNYVVFPIEEISDAHTLSFFETLWEAKSMALRCQMMKTITKVFL